MNFKRFRVICGIIVLAAVIVFSWGCQNQPTGPESITKMEAGTTPASSKTRGYSSGTDHGYFYSLYWEGGSASISFSGAGTYAGNFAISYSNVDDVVGGKGWNPGSSSRTIHYNIGCLSGSYNFIGVYGWTTNPLIEYYVAEMGSASGGTYCGTVSSDGHTYSVYKQQRVDAPSIQGTATFWQYKSSWGGASTGSNRQVTMSNHWNAWQSMCGSLGSCDYQIFALEAWGGKSGYINATVWNPGSGSATTTAGSTTTTTSSTSTTTSGWWWGGGGSTTTTSGGWW